LLWLNLFLLRLGLNAVNILLTWLVLQTTDSAFLLGTVTGLKTAPFGFGLIAGVLSDQFDKRTLLMISNFVFISVILILGFIISMGQIQFWHILLATFILHTLTAFETPARQVFTTEIVGRDNTINGVALNGLAMRTASVIGATLIGVFIDGIGIGRFFYLIGAFAVVAFIAVAIIQTDTERNQQDPAEVDESITMNVLNGLNYLRKKKILLGLQLVALSHNFFTGVCLFTLMPVFASTVLHIDAASLGWINTMSGLGSLIAGLGLASFSRDFRHTGWLIPIGALIEGGMWVLFSTTSNYYFSVFFVMSSAIGMITYMTAIETLLLTNSDVAMRGRMMGIRALVILPQAVWGLILGALSQVIGVPLTIALAGTSHCLSTLAVTLLVPSIIRLE
jgi:MFS family permease